MATILLIDDDADLSRFLLLSLEQQGHRVACLERAERGPEILGQQAFDLVLLDNKMPGMSGIEFLAALQRRGLGVPVILMTGHATTDTAIQAMNLGAFDYVIKPLELDQLVDELGPLPAFGRRKEEGGRRKQEQRLIPPSSFLLPPSEARP